jgi:hypothetical protein
LEPNLDHPEKKRARGLEPCGRFTTDTNLVVLRVAEALAITLRVPVVFPLHAPVAPRSPDQQPKPDGDAEQTHDGSEEDDDGHAHMIAGFDARGQHEASGRSGNLLQVPRRSVQSTARRSLTLLAPGRVTLSRRALRLPVGDHGDCSRSPWWIDKTTVGALAPTVCSGEQVLD